MTDQPIQEQPDVDPAADSTPRLQRCFIGTVAESSRPGYVRFTTLTNPQQSYDLPQEWCASQKDVTLIRVDQSAGALRVKPALKDGNAQSPVEFDDLAEQPLIAMAFPPGRLDV